MNMIPVILVPGIMGSNVRVRSDVQDRQIKGKTDRPPEGYRQGDPAWRPPNGIKSSISELVKWQDRSPAQRQAILDPNNTEVDDQKGLISLDANSQINHPNHDPRASERGWGTVHWDSYGEILEFLHWSLCRVRQFETLPGRPPVFTDTWNRLLKATGTDAGKSHVAQAAFALAATEIDKLRSYQFPVYASGYNWLQSNRVSGQKLAELIQRLKTLYSAKPQVFKGVIIVTHSMGGLVARSCAKALGDADILGVIHGVMPATGAPLAYSRCVRGTESFNSDGKTTVANSGFAVIAGNTREKATPVLANAAGPLELLPNHAYPRNWLNLSVLNQAGERITMQLPKSGDPYQEIYRNRTAFYRLVDESMLDPLGRSKSTSAGTNGPWMSYIERITEAESFHRSIYPDGIGSGYFHKATYAHFGNDPQHKAFGTFSWIQKSKAEIDAEDVALSQQQQTMDPFGSIPMYTPLPTRTHYPVEFRHPLPDSLGDGTVPAESGVDPASKKPATTFKMVGFDHQTSYKDVNVKDMALWSIAKIVGTLLP